MLKTSTLFILLIAFVNSIHAQTFSYPQINKTGKSIHDFVPAGWTILQSVKGDLNKDGLPDVVLVLQHIDTVQLITVKDDDKDTVTTKPRLLAIVFKNERTTGYSLAQQSNTFILTNEQKYMDDPLEPIIIKTGILNIKFNVAYSMGSWYTDINNYKFRFQNNEFKLIGADSYSLHRANHDFTKYSFNFSTHKRILTIGNEDKGRKKVHYKTFPNTKLQSLTTFTAPFTWEVEPDIFL